MTTIYINGSSVKIPCGYTVRRYGDDRTVLRLSETAQRMYEATNPLYIYEIENEDEGEIGYLIDGCFSEGLEPIEGFMVNAILEEAFEEMMEADEKMMEADEDDD